MSYNREPDICSHIFKDHPNSLCPALITLPANEMNHQNSRDVKNFTQSSLVNEQNLRTILYRYIWKKRQKSVSVYQLLKTYTSHCIINTALGVL
jgi:hypothetical protein